MLKKWNNSEAEIYFNGESLVFNDIKSSDYTLQIEIYRLDGSLLCKEIVLH